MGWRWVTREQNPKSGNFSENFGNWVTERSTYLHNRQTRWSTRGVMKGPKPTIIWPLIGAHWRGHHAGSGIRPRQAFPNRLVMKNWPFAGLKNGSTTSAVKNWHDDFSMIQRLKPPWEALSINGRHDNQQFINFDERNDDSLGKPRYYLWRWWRRSAAYCLITLTLHSMTTTDEIIILLPHYAPWRCVRERKPHVKRPSDQSYRWVKCLLAQGYCWLLTPLIYCKCILLPSYFHPTSYLPPHLPPEVALLTTRVW